MNGFEKKRNYKIYVKTNDNTIVRLDFSKMNGVLQLRINHTNFSNQRYRVNYFSRYKKSCNVV